MKGSVPQTILVHPFPYKVKTGKTTQKLLADAGNNGAALHDTQEILIATSPSLRTVQDTVLHEVLHCVWTQTDLKRSPDVSDHEERIIWTLTPRLLAVLRDNPQLVEFLTEES